MTDRNALGPAARLNLDILAFRDSLGVSELHQTERGCYTLHVPTMMTDRRLEPVHNVAARTLRELHAAGLIEYPDGDEQPAVRITDLGRQLARPSEAPRLRW